VKSDRQAICDPAGAARKLHNPLLKKQLRNTETHHLQACPHSEQRSGRPVSAEFTDSVAPRADGRAAGLEIRTSPAAGTSHSRATVFEATFGQNPEADVRSPLR